MGDQLHATHTPLQLVSSEGQEWLHGHIAKANPQVDHIRQQARATAILWMPTLTFHHRGTIMSMYQHGTTWLYTSMGCCKPLMKNKPALRWTNSWPNTKIRIKNISTFPKMTEQDIKAHLRGFAGFPIDHWKNWGIMEAKPKQGWRQPRSHHQ